MIEMNKSVLKRSFVKAIVLALITMSIAAFGGTMPSDIYRAKTVFLSCWADTLNECRYPKALESIQQQLASGGRWTVISEPAKADLILVFLDDESRSSTYTYRASIVRTRHFCGVIVLKGGGTPDWDAMPLYATGGATIISAFQQLYDDVNRTAPLLIPKALFPAPTSKHVVRWGRSVEEYTQIILDEPGNATAYYARGAAYSDKGDFDSAIKDFNMALRLKPDFDEAGTRLESAKKAKAAWPWDSDSTPIIARSASSDKTIFTSGSDLLERR
jgi:tetratricopeptide (TPR) repeat protein